MSLIKSKPTLLPDLPRFFDDFFTKDIFDWTSRNFSPVNTTLPETNVRESHEEFVVEMAIPGMNKKDFRIELDNEVLKISSEQHSEEELKEGERFTRREFNYQAFQRTFHLPKSVVDDSKIKAKYENGILRIVIPKKEEAKALPPRKINIQ